ncbi:hypothetical protein WJX77_009497 [Trebouxia sp. C0004]
MRVSLLRNKVGNLLHLEGQLCHFRVFRNHKIIPYCWPITPSRQQQRLRISLLSSSSSSSWPVPIMSW